MSLQLYYTPRSHFSRKVRLLLAAYRLECQLLDAGNVGDCDPQAFGANPLLKVPCLVDGAQVVFDSDHIAVWLTRRHAPHDPLRVLSEDPDRLNARAVMNGVMAAEVEWILAERSGIEAAALARFRKLRAGMLSGLDWLEQQAGQFEGEPDYGGLHLVCLLDHLRLYGVIEVQHPRLEAAAQRLSSLPWVAASRPP